ncbi:hypothetical protein P618_201148 [Holospora obtusa F1]|uniref:Transposase n=1 Tax=Holospora obtusa F1 TaxID=1399147 RepID=W6TFB8_HOLOB|nr:hypothetical protein P618_201148 [Holospora obtusa F1]
MRRYALRNDQWYEIKKSLPGKLGDLPNKDNRLFVKAGFYTVTSPWRNLSEKFCDFKA